MGLRLCQDCMTWREQVIKERKYGGREYASFGSVKPWASHRGSGSFMKACKNRWERRRAKQNPEVPPTYGRYYGWSG